MSVLDMKRLAIICLALISHPTISANQGPGSIINSQSPGQTNPLPAEFAEDADLIERAAEGLADAQKKAETGELTAEQHQGYVAQVKEVVSEVAAKSPESAAVQTSAARAFSQAGDLPAAMGYANKALAIAPNDPFPLVTRGLIAFNSGDYPAADADALKALKADPGNKAAMAIHKLAQGRAPRTLDGLSMKEAARQAAEARQIFAMSAPSPLDDPRVKAAGLKAEGRQKALAILPESMNKINLGDYEGAVESASRAIAADDRLGAAYFQRGLALSLLKQDAKAAPDYDKAIHEWSVTSATDTAFLARLSQAYQARARSHLNLGQAAQSAADASRSLALTPHSARAHHIRAQAKRALGEKAQSWLADFKEAAQLDAKSYAADYEKALASLEEGNTSAPPSRAGLPALAGLRRAAENALGTGLPDYGLEAGCGLAGLLILGIGVLVLRR